MENNIVCSFKCCNIFTPRFFISFPVLLVIDFTPLLFIIPDYWIITLPFIISLPLSYLITSFAQKKMIKDLRTRIMSRRLFGVVLVLFQVWTFASNMIQGYIEIANAIGIICGLVFIFNNPKTAKI